MLFVFVEEVQRETDLGQYIGKKESYPRGLERWKRQRLSVGWICVVLGQVLGKETQGSLSHLSGFLGGPG